MPTVVIDGITTNYSTTGDGPPLLMFSPGGFEAVAAHWSDLGIYRSVRLLEHLPRSFTCITFDRREAGGSGGRIERLSWNSYAVQAKGLLDHLGVPRAHLLGGCVGCSVAARFAVAYPQAVGGMVLFSPAGGPRYRMTQQLRFASHLAYVEQNGLPEVVELAQRTQDTFSRDPRIGPWGGSARRDPDFAAGLRRFEPGRYRYAVSGTARVLFDRDTVPGAEPEDLMALEVPALIIPGDDASHAPSAARYLHECLAGSRFWDVPVTEQVDRDAPGVIRSFLQQAG